VKKALLELQQQMEAVENSGNDGECAAAAVLFG
jgi:hypothetical protein